MHTLAIVQARVGSSRLPGKVLAEVAGRPMLWYPIRRTQLAKRVDQVVVAIPDTLEDLDIAQLCAAWDVHCIAGPEHDVLARYLAIAQAWQPTPDIIVRITADCPLIDPGVIDAVLTLFDRQETASVVYASNIFPERTFPDGLDVEAFPLSTLELLSELATDPADREHVTAYLHRHPKQFLGPERAIRSARLPARLGDLRWTVDTAEDLAFVRMVFEDWRCPWDATMHQLLAAARPRIIAPGGSW